MTTFVPTLQALCMFLKNKPTRAIGLGVALMGILGSFLFVQFNLPDRVQESIWQYSYERSASACNEKFQDTDGRLTCWLNIVEKEVKVGGIERAFRIFTHLYEKYPEFGASGCHTNAHAIGDTAYYEIYVARNQSLQEYSFPLSTKSCGYGFFHGFIEHLIQDNPETEFAVQTCTYLHERYGAEMSQLENICYHASGHGYMQAEADRMSTDEWGNVARLIRRPLVSCSKFTNATPRQREECREGIFNVVSDWMIAKNFGLSFDAQTALRLCDTLARVDQRACYSEFAMKLYPVLQDDPVKAAAYADTLQRKEFSIVAFNVMIAGMMERKVPRDTYGEVFSACTKLTETYFETCVRSSVGGMMAHGSPGTEYERVLIACENAHLIDRNGRAFCYSELTNKLNRLYPHEERQRICDLFPEEYTSSCRPVS